MVASRSTSSRVHEDARRRRDRERLANEMLGVAARKRQAVVSAREPDRPVRPMHERIDRPVLRELLSRVNIEHRIEDLFGAKREQEHRAARRNVHERREARRNGQPESRCRDWMLHHGNVHYVRNAASFRSGAYTRLDLSARLGAQEYRVVGIGSVELVTERAFHAPEGCGITLHDVLHIQKAPCNGISIPKLRAAGVDVRLGDGGANMTRMSDGIQLACGTRFSRLFRMCMYNEPEPEPDTLLPHLDLHSSYEVECVADSDLVARKGHAARELQGIEYSSGTRYTSEGVGISC